MARIEIEEYKSRDVWFGRLTPVSKPGSKSRWLVANRFEIAGSMVMGVFTARGHTPASRDVYAFEALSRLFSVEALLAPATHLRMRDEVEWFYRDFSKSGRIGELAQAIARLHAIRELKYQLVLDYNGFLTSQKLTIAPGTLSTPDYALLSANTSRKVSFLEAKGTLISIPGTSMLSMLRAGLKQVRSGAAYLRHQRPKAYVGPCYGTAVRFSAETAAANSMLAFCDPVDDDGEVPPNFMWAARFYYAAWLDACDLPEDAERLRGDGEFHIQTRTLDAPYGEYAGLQQGPKSVFRAYAQVLGKNHQVVPVIARAICDSLASGNLDSLLKSLAAVSDSLLVNAPGAEGEREEASGFFGDGLGLVLE